MSTRGVVTTTTRERSAAGATSMKAASTRAYKLRISTGQLKTAAKQQLSKRTSR